MEAMRDESDQHEIMDFRFDESVAIVYDVIGFQPFLP